MFFTYQTIAVGLRHLQTRQNFSAPTLSSYCSIQQFTFLSFYICLSARLPPCSCYFRSHLTRITVNISQVTKTSRALLSPSVHNGTDNLIAEMLFVKMGLYNSIVTALYWKQLSWEGSPSLSVSLIFSHSPFSYSLSHSLARFSFFFHFPSSLVSLLISSKTSQIPKSCPALAESVCEHSSQVGLWDPLCYIDISGCRVCS